MRMTQIVLDAGDIRLTKGGYMTAFPRVARMGIQIYRGAEVERPEMEQVRVYRPEGEVFSRDAMRSFAHCPVTLDHPPVLVTNDNWRKYARGHIGDEIVRDGDTVRVPMVLMDSEAIQSVKDGKCELSMGYTCDLKWEPGVTKSGEKYDAIQTNIRANHLAVVAAARGGPNLRIGDDEHKRGDQVMEKQITVDGVPLTMSEVAAGVVQRAIQSFNDKLTALQTQFDQYKSSAEAEKKKKEEEEETMKRDSVALQTQVANKDAEIAALKKAVEDSKVSGPKLDQMVRDREGIKAKAVVVLGDGAAALSDKTNEEIRRAVVDHVLKDKAKGWSDEYVQISFDSIQVDVADANNGGGGNAFQFAQNLAVDSQSATVIADREKAYGEMKTKLQDAWKNPAALRTQ